MTKKQPKTDTTNAVMDRIKQGDVTMRPKLYFALLIAIASFAAATAGIVLAYLVSILYFWQRILASGTMAYGARSRLAEAIDTFPWWLAILAVLLTVGALWLARRQSRLYKYRTSLLLALLLAASLLLGIVFVQFNIGQPYAEHRMQSGQHGPMWQRGE